jgi:dTDP-4-amino-4,6-dideoxygalactose transaminase
VIDVPGASEPPAVPFVDLCRQHAAMRAEIDTAVAEAISSSQFLGGRFVDEFESAFAAFCGARHCVAVSSGFDALLYALRATIAPGDEVIVPGATFVATYEAVAHAGGTIRAVDIDTVDYTLDPDAVEAALSPRTRVLLPVHLYGQLADMSRLNAIAAREGIALLEDACQAHGAARDGFRAGSSARGAGFSFYPSKNLGALGDAGAFVTDEPELAAAVKALRSHGQPPGGGHETVGFTGRIDALQAALLAAKLRHLADWNAARADAAGLYRSTLEGIGDLVLPRPRGEHVWHLYVIRTADPDGLQRFLAQRGIESRRHYERPPHLEEAFAFLGLGPGSLPAAERLSREALSLPIFPGISEAEIEQTCEAVRSYFSTNALSSAR